MTSEEPLPNRCAAKCRNGGYCENHPVDGSDRCRMHGGSTPTKDENPDVGAPDDSTNAVTHGLYAETNRFYQEVVGDDIRELIDDIFADYLEEYIEIHGGATTGAKAELFRIAVSYGKHVYSDNWAVMRPDELDPGHALVDEETHRTDEGGQYSTYKETVVAKGQARLSRDRRSWLKDAGLMDKSPESKQADAAEGIISVLSEESNR